MVSTVTHILNASVINNILIKLSKILIFGQVFDHLQQCLTLQDFFFLFYAFGLLMNLLILHTELTRIVPYTCFEELL